MTAQENACGLVEGTDLGRSLIKQFITVQCPIKLFYQLIAKEQPG